MSGVPSEIERGGTAIGFGNGGPTGGSGPVIRTTIAQPVLPCPGCAHREVCAIRPKLEAAELAMRSPMSPDPAITIRLAVTVECSHYLADGAPPPELEVAPRRRTTVDLAAARQRGQEASRQKVTGAAAAEMAAASRRRGTEAHLAGLAAKRGPAKGTPGKAWTPEHRAAFEASMARKRAGQTTVVDESDEAPD